MKHFSSVLVVSVTFLASACSKSTSSEGSPEAQAAAQASAAIADAVAKNLPPEVAQAVEGAKSAGGAPVNGAPVDVCALLDQADAEAVLGKLSEPPKPGTPTGSLLGECTWQSTSKGFSMLTISARPAAEFKDTLDLATKSAPGKAIAGLGAEASQTRMGLMIKLADKPYFLTLLGTPKDPEKEAIARKLKL
jgi:hypothetical protein